MIQRIPAGSYAAYAGIGSRETPEDVLKLMETLGARLGALGYTLRTGGAEGADTAFMLGSPRELLEVFVPWSGFVRHPDLAAACRVITHNPRYEDALALAEAHHPRWQACSPGARKLHARNVAQVHGQDLETPSKFVVCWTKTGGAHGGTGQALRLAEAASVPIFNLRLPGCTEELLTLVEAAERD